MPVCGKCRQPVVWLIVGQGQVAVAPKPDRDAYRAERVGPMVYGRRVGPTHRRHRCPESPSTAPTRGDAA